MKIIDLRSDTVTRPSAAMKQAMFNAPLGDDVFGDDPTVNQLQAETARLLGKQAGLFVPSGTMGNQIALKTLTNHGDEVILDYESHIFRYEVAGAAVISGLQFNAITGSGGIMTSEQVANAIRPADIHQPATALVCLENTHNRAGGVVYPLAEIKKISALCKKHKIKMHLDGARLWNAAIASGISLKEYSGYFDSVMVCFSKGVGCPVGSVLAGDKEFIEKARRNRKMMGGGMRQAGILAGACLYSLKHNLKRIAEDHRRARKLAQMISQIPKVKIDLMSVQTNIVVFDIKRTGMNPEQAMVKLARSGLWVLPFGETKLRAVTHLDVDDNDIPEFRSINIHYSPLRS
ncbi:low-specificity L-threonine aldolase [candidate division TA06 bacterium]|uniref:Low-specificity L-threonine aldolase n=1 Tax=candidate division TA06 bacterium TaxID=2250710 RepID=A0A933I9N3_UNCT6|nr:low-specificity L-threonine aldolase [candidate division TA06 bacterium]